MSSVKHETFNSETPPIAIWFLPPRNLSLPPLGLVQTPKHNMSHHVTSCHVKSRQQSSDRFISDFSLNNKLPPEPHETARNKQAEALRPPSCAYRWAMLWLAPVHIRSECIKDSARQRARNSRLIYNTNSETSAPFSGIKPNQPPYRRYFRETYGSSTPYKALYINTSIFYEYYILLI